MLDPRSDDCKLHLHVASDASRFMRIINHASTFVRRFFASLAVAHRPPGQRR